MTEAKAELLRAISLIEKRIEEMQQFDLSKVTDRHNPELEKLEHKIDETLSRCLGDGSTDYRRYRSAAGFYLGPTHTGFRNSNPRPVRAYVTESMERNIATLEALLASLRERLDEIPEEDAAAVKESEAIEYSNEIFIVHGHTKETDAVARLVERLGLRAVILHEKPNEGQTVIEKFEKHADVGFAIVLLTPDDECLSAGKAVRRARQNVILELGYFVGFLGRPRVCALKQGDVELPSDIFGIVWTDLDAAGMWKYKLGQELKAAGYKIDMNRLA